MKLKNLLNISDRNWIALKIRPVPKGISCVYLFIKGGFIIYVGTTKCLKSRLLCHHISAINCNIYYTVIKNGRLNLEKELIKLISPQLNSKLGTPILPSGEKLAPVTVFVKTKNKELARSALLITAARFR